MVASVTFEPVPSPRSAAVLIAGWFIYPGIGFIGLLFAVVWLMIVYLRAEVLRRQQRGLLPGQQQGD